MTGGIAVAVGLARVGGPLAAPPVASWTGLCTWYEEIGPSVALMTAVRGAALVVAGWFVLACLLQLAATLPVGGPVRLLADVFAPSSVRRLAQGFAGASLSAGLLVTPSLPGRTIDGQPGTATMQPLGTDDVPAAPAAPAEPAAPVAGPDLYTVARSESFWSIAEDRVAEVSSDVPEDRQIARYWLRLIEANRDRLVDPGNDDLLYSGQVLVLPSAP